jgi:putative DNA primase/helicase
MDAIMEELRTADDQTAEAMRFLATTFAPDDWVEVRLLPSGSSRWFQLANSAEASSVIRWAVDLNARTQEPQNVYVGGNPRDAAGAKGNKSVPLARSVFADFDGGTTVEEALQRIHEADLPEPSIVIVSGGGVHVYWVLLEPVTDTATWTVTMKGIIAVVRSDKSIHNAERIMRLPGTRNVKPEREGRPLCRIVTINETRHDIEAFPVTSTAKPQRATKPKQRHGRLGDEAQRFIDTGTVEGERRPAIYRIACDMKARGWTLAEATAAIMSRVHRIVPSLTQEDIDDIPRQIENAFKGEREPGHESSPAQRDAQAVIVSAVTDEPHDGAVDLCRPHTFTDVGMGRRLVKMTQGRLLYVRERKMFAHWDGRRWTMPADHIAEHMAKRLHDELWSELQRVEGERRAAAAKYVLESGTRPRIAAAVWSWQSEPKANTSQADFDAHPMLLNVRNGVIDLRNGELMPHNPGLRLTQMAAVDYEQDARSELWERFIREVTSGDEERAEFLQQAFGLALTGDVSDEVLVCHNGGGCNGKSTALEAVGKMLGDYAAVAPPGMFAARKFDAHPTEIAGLRGKRFVTATEQEANKALRESLIKQMTGGDTIRTRGMREDFWEMVPTWHIHIAYNTAPRLSGTDDGIRRRLRVVPWDASFKHAPDPTIKERLTGEAERAGILNWCLDGLRKRLASGRLFSPESVMIATEEYIDDEDLIGRFIVERTEGDTDSVIEVREMLRAFREWMQADGAPRYVVDGFTATALGRELARRGYRKMRPDSGLHRKQTVIAGLRLVNTMDDLPDSMRAFANFE